MKLRKWTKEQYILLLVLAVAAAVIYAWHPGCIWQKTFGAECLTCGTSRGMAALIRLHPLRAWRYNPLVYCLPFWAAALVTLGRPFEKKRANIGFWVFTGVLTAILLTARAAAMIFFPR